MRTLAGFAANQRSSPENGSLPKRFFLAGTTCAEIFKRPDSVNSPAPFLCTAPRMVSSSADRTALTAFRSTVARSARYAASDAFVNVSLIGDSVAVVFTAAFFATVAGVDAAFLAATFLTGAAAVFVAAFLAAVFAEVGMFLLPVEVSVF